MSKKKVLISQPMRGLSTEQIKTNREQAVETVIVNGCEVLDSIFDFDDDSAYAKLNPDANKRLTDYAANLFYSPAEQIDIGMEYHQGKREVFDGRTADVSRINFVSMYKF